MKKPECKLTAEDQLEGLRNLNRITQQEVLTLESRIYSLEKEMQLLTSVIGLVMFVGVFFLIRRQIAVSEIPGVTT